MILFQPKTDNFQNMCEYAQAHQLGFEVINFYFPTVLDDEDTVNRLLAMYKGKPVHAMHGVFIDINYSGGDPLVMNASRKRIEQCASCAVHMGIKRIVLHSCFFPLLVPNDMLYDIWAEESANLLIEIAEKYDVEFVIENMLDITPNIIVKMMKAANHPRIGACLDVGHANLSKTPIARWIEDLHPYLRHVHLNDNFGIYDEHLPLGMGNVDWPEVDGQFRQYKVQADYTIELKTLSEIRASYEYILSGAMPYVGT